MDEIERSLAREAERMRPEVDEGLDATFRKVRSRRRIRRAATGIVALALPLLVFGMVWLAFRASTPPQPAGPPPSPSTRSPSAAAGSCDWAGIGGAVPPGYATSGPILHGDVDADGTTDAVRVLTDESRPEACRWVLRVDTGGGSELASVITPLDWPGTAPEPLLLAQIDGRDGLEVVVDLSPAAVYRPGAVFTVLDGHLVRMELQGSMTPELFPLDDEFPAGVDCTPDPTIIVVTTGTLADGGADDGRWEITRIPYGVLDGVRFVPVGGKTYVVPVGPEAERRWRELRGQPFRSCPSQVG